MINIISEKDGVLRVAGSGDFSVFRTFDCGQCFRFDRVENSKYECEFSGVARGRKIGFAQNAPGEFYMIGAGAAELPLWIDYLALDVDYDTINESIISGIENTADRDFMRRARDASLGIRILRQDKWEALCSFIISQNNNIPRIKKIIGAMCEKYGRDIGGAFDFPSAAALEAAGEAEIFELKCGFRAKYIHSAATAVSNGFIDLDSISPDMSFDDASQVLTSLKGVGPKVAACTLLFGFERYDAFPIDVWIRKVLERHFTPCFDPASFGRFAGIAQQYLFYYERYLGGDV